MDDVFLHIHIYIMVISTSIRHTNGIKYENGSLIPPLNWSTSKRRKLSCLLSLEYAKSPFKEKSVFAT